MINAKHTRFRAKQKPEVNAAEQGQSLALVALIMLLLLTAWAKTCLTNTLSHHLITELISVISDDKESQGDSHTTKENRKVFC